MEGDTCFQVNRNGISIIPTYTLIPNAVLLGLILAHFRMCALIFDIVGEAFADNTRIFSVGVRVVESLRLLLNYVLEVLSQMCLNFSVFDFRLPC